MIFISKTIDGATKTRHFIGADKTASRDEAVQITLHKCRITIDRLGDTIFG